MLKRYFYFDTDPDSGGGGADPATPPADPPQATPPKTEAITFTAEQQAHLDKLIGKARTDGRESAKKELEAAQQKATQEAEEKRLKEQAEWQKLAETHETKVKEIEPQLAALTQRVGEYETLVTELLDSKLKALGDAAKTAIEALPGTPDVLAKLRWLNANEKLFKQPALGPGNQTKTRQPATTLIAPTPAQRIVRF